MNIDELKEAILIVVKPLLPVLYFSASFALGLSVMRKIISVFDDIPESSSLDALETDYMPSYHKRYKRKLSRTQRAMLFHRGGQP